MADFGAAPENDVSPRAVIHIVMFHVFRERDVRVEEMIALAVRSFRIHYPEARVVLLTNDAARTMRLPPDLHLQMSVADTPHVMLERVRGYRDYLRTVPTGTVVVFLDTDMLVVRRFDELFEPDIDLAVTVRNVPRMPINGGFILARMARRERILAFFDRFHECCAAMPEDQRKWDGDQLALSQHLDSPPLPMLSVVTGERDGLTVRFAPARVFNQTPRPNFLRYGLFRPGARILHFKGARKVEMPRYARRFLSRPYVAFVRLFQRRGGK